MSAEIFYTELYINASPEKVWEAFIVPTGFFKAAFGTEIDSSFRVGEKIEFRGEKDGQQVIHMYGNIIAYKQYEILHYTEHPGAIYTPKYEEMISEIKVTFEQANKSTRVTLLNDKFSEQGMREKADQWYLVLSSLKTYVETGNPL